MGEVRFETVGVEKISAAKKGAKRTSNMNRIW